MENDGALATVSAGKDKIRIFQEAVEQDDEFAHDGSERELGGFSIGSESLVKVSEDVVVMAGGERSHVEDAADNAPYLFSASAARPQRRL
jgi:hypothetical protein